MAGVKLTHDEICSLIINPQTGRPLDKTTLEKAFVDELANGKAKMKSLLGSKFMERMQAGDAWALQFGLRHISGWRDPNAGVGVNVGNGTDENGQPTTQIEVRFVPPPKWDDDDFDPDAE